MKYRINYYSDRRIMQKNIHIMDPRTTGTFIDNYKKEFSEEQHERIISKSQFIVPWQLI